MNLPRVFRRPRNLMFVAGTLVVLGVVVAPFVYINFIKEDAPPRLKLGGGTSTTTPGPSSSTTTAAASGNQTSGELDGTWKIAAGSEVGYRAKEVLFGQDSEAVGRTSNVEGQFTFIGTTLQAAEFSVDMTTVASDEDRRDGQFHGRIMDTKTYPKATFKLTAPVTIEQIPAKGEPFDVEVAGTFTIRGVTKNVTLTLKALNSDESIEINGLFPVIFSDYAIPDPSFGPAEVQDRGAIEFLLKFSRI